MSCTKHKDIYEDELEQDLPHPSAEDSVPVGRDDLVSTCFGVNLKVC